MNNFQTQEGKLVTFYKAHKTLCLVVAGIVFLIGFAALFGFRP